MKYLGLWGEKELFSVANAQEKAPEKQDASWSSKSAVVLKICFSFWEEQKNILSPEAERYKQLQKKQS